MIIIDDMQPVIAIIYSVTLQNEFLAFQFISVNFLLL